MPPVPVNSTEFPCLLQGKGKYRRDQQLGRRKETWLWRVSSATQDAALVDQAERNRLFRAKDLKAVIGFPGEKDTFISRLGAQCLGARHATLKEHLTEEHKLFRLAFAESNEDRKWERVIFSDESIFTSAKDRPVLVYILHGQRYNPQYVYLQTQWSCVCKLLGLDLT